MPSLIVVFDTCVLFPAVLRDTLLTAAEANLYELYFTDDILEELRRNLVSQRGIPENKAQKVITIMKEVFRESLVTNDYRTLIAAMPNNEKDRHVLAAAVACNAQIIVTQNLRVFPQHHLAPFSIKAQAPDEFLTHLFYLNSKQVTEMILNQALKLHNPPKTPGELLNTLNKHTPNFVQLVRRELRL